MGSLYGRSEVLGGLRVVFGRFETADECADDFGLGALGGFAVFPQGFHFGDGQSDV